jgi:hypothetical protein
MTSMPPLCAVCPPRAHAKPTRSPAKASATSPAGPRSVRARYRSSGTPEDGTACHTPPGAPSHRCTICSHLGTQKRWAAWPQRIHSRLQSCSGGPASRPSSRRRSWPSGRASATDLAVGNLLDEAARHGQTWTARQVTGWLARERGVRLSISRFRVLLRHEEFRRKRTKRSVRRQRKDSELQAHQEADLEPCCTHSRVLGRWTRPRSLGRRLLWGCGDPRRCYR